MKNNNQLRSYCVNSSSPEWHSNEKPIANQLRVWRREKNSSFKPKESQRGSGTCCCLSAYLHYYYRLFVREPACLLACEPALVSWPEVEAASIRTGHQIQHFAFLLRHGQSISKEKRTTSDCPLGFLVTQAGSPMSAEYQRHFPDDLAPSKAFIDRGILHFCTW